MIKTLNKTLVIALIIISSFFPLVSFAETIAAKPFKLDYSGLVKCDGVPTPGEEDRQEKCNFAALMNMVKSTINWLFVLVVSISIVSVAYGGAMYITGVPKNIDKAHSIFKSIAYGFGIMLIAWFSVITVVNWFVTSDTQKVVNTFVNTGK